MHGLQLRRHKLRIPPRHLKRAVPEQVVHGAQILIKFRRKT
jgi:hypothetical protein